MLRFTFHCVLIACLAACGSDGDARAIPLHVGAAQAPAEQPTSIDWTAIDDTVDPCDDFYHYACGSWQRQHPIRTTATAVARTDDARRVVSQQLADILRADVVGARASDDPGAELMANYYTSCMNAPDDAASRTDVAMRLAAMSAGSPEAIARQVVQLWTLGATALFDMRIVSDDGDPTHRLLMLDQGGLGLRNRADYLDPERAALREDYRRQIVELSKLFDAPEIDADRVIALETALAQAALDPQQRIDRMALYHPMTGAELSLLAPVLAWSSYFEALQVSAKEVRLSVASPDYFSALSRLLEHTTERDLRAYFAWRLILRAAPLLDAPVVDADASFWAGHYGGAAQTPARGTVCLNAVVNDLGFELAQPYLARNLEPGVTEAAMSMIAEIRMVLKRRLEQADWLDDATRAAALDKLDAMLALVAGPSRWSTTDGLEGLTPTSYWLNSVRLTRWQRAGVSQALSSSPARLSWSLGSYVVNARYDRARNLIMVPLAILNAPYFVLGDAPSNNYGALGAVIGHELSHGFDASGREYDARGALHDWWTDDVSRAFDERAHCLIDQFDGYHVETGQSLNGGLTVNENLADLSGLSVAYEAWSSRGVEEAPVHDHTARQQFFLAFAQLQCINERPETLAQDLMADVHSPGEFRVNGTLVNMPQFAAAYGCSSRAPAVAAPPDSRAECSFW